MDALSRSLDGAACDYLRQIAWIRKDETADDDELRRPHKDHRMSAGKGIERTDKTGPVSEFFLVGAHSSPTRKVKIGKIQTSSLGRPLPSNSEEMFLVLQTPWPTNTMSRRGCSQT